MIAHRLSTITGADRIYVLKDGKIQEYGSHEELLDKKIKDVVKHTIVSELGIAVFVNSAQMILKLGIASVASVGGILLADGTINILIFFMFLLVVSRMCMIHFKFLYKI